MENILFSFKTEMKDYEDIELKEKCLNKIIIFKDGGLFISQHKLSDKLDAGYVKQRIFFGKIYQYRVVGLKASTFYAIAQEYEKILKSGFIKTLN
jgi:hypothetical protein